MTLERYAHVRQESADTIAWCGSPLAEEFYFKNAEFAAMSTTHESTHRMCIACAQALLGVFLKSVPPGTIIHDEPDGA